MVRINLSNTCKVSTVEHGLEKALDTISYYCSCQNAYWTVGGYLSPGSVREEEAAWALQVPRLGLPLSPVLV